MSRYIKHLILEGEGQRLDFKYEISDARKIAKTLVAFSNTEGGKLLIGVKDNGRIAGIRSEEEYYMLDSAARLFCKPEVELNYRKWTIEGKTILEAQIPEGNTKPYYCKQEDGKWMAFIRQDDENFLADIVQLKAWKNKYKASGVLLKYTEKEKLILESMNKHELTGIEQLIDDTGLKRRQLVHILAKLVSFGLVEVFSKEKGASYRLAKK